MQVRPYNTALLRPFEALAPYAKPTDNSKPSPFCMYMPTPGHTKVWTVAHLVQQDRKQLIRAAYPLWTELSREQARQLIDGLALFELEFLSPWYSCSLEVMQEILSQLGEIAGNFEFLQFSMQHAGKVIEYQRINWVVWNIWEHKVVETFDPETGKWVAKPKSFTHVHLHNQNKLICPLIEEVRFV